MNTTLKYSHPEQQIRHSYPLAVTTTGFSTALSLCLKTLPFIFLRLGILVAFAVGAVIWFAICGGIASLFAGKTGEHAGGGIVLFLIAVALPGGIYAWLRNYVLYMLKLGHVAALTKLITDGAIPENTNQVEYGKGLITARFAEANTLYVLDALITGVVQAFNSTLDWVTRLIPIPGLDNVTKVVQAVIKNATTYIDETIFSYNLARGDDNVWRSSTDGLVYYGQNVKAVLKTAAWALIIEYVCTAILFLICLAPAALIGYLLPSAVAGFAWVFALILAAAIRSALLNPIFLTMVMLTYHTSIKDQPIDLSVSEKLNSVSGKFKELGEKARQWVAPVPQKS